MSIDPRLIERRKTVAEDHAKRNMSRLLKFLALVCVLGALVWLVFSPWLSVSRVSATGIQSSDAYRILAENNVVAGTPMVRVSASGAEAALLDDPWIAEADVTLAWPDEVTVEIAERDPVAWTQTDGGWTRRAVDGVALPSEETPDPEMVHIEMPDLADVAALTSPDILGALEFAESLAPRWKSSARVTTIDGELWATVAGYQVRLGRGVDMTEKALSLEALLATSIPEGSVIVLIAPTNPAVLTPQGAASVDSDNQGSGDQSSNSPDVRSDTDDTDDG